MEHDGPSTTTPGAIRDEGSPALQGIVVVGASAGGLNALQQVLEGQATNRDGGGAEFVVELPAQVSP